MRKKCYRCSREAFFKRDEVLKEMKKEGRLYFICGECVSSSTELKGLEQTLWEGEAAEKYLNKVRDEWNDDC